MRERLMTFMKRRFVRDSLLLQAGMFASTGISIAVSVAVARILGVNTYGEYALLGAFLGVITIFTDAGADSAALTQLASSHAKGDAKASARTIGAYLKANALFVGVIGMALVTVTPWLAGRFYGNVRIGAYAQWWLIANMFLVPASLVALVLQAGRRMRTLVVFETTNEAIKAVGKVVLPFLGFGLAGLVAGQLFSSLAVCALGVVAYRTAVAHDLHFPSLPSLWSQARDASLRGFLRFSLLLSLEKNFGNFISLLPLLFLGATAPPAVAGFYKIAYSYVAFPLIGLSGVSRLLGVTFPRSLTEGATVLRQKFLRASLWSGATFLILVAPTVILAPVAVRVVYGDQYLPVVKIIYALAVVMAPLGFTVGFGSLFRTLGKVRTSLTLNLACLVFVIALAVFLYPHTSALHTTLIALGTWHYIGCIAAFILARKLLNEIESGKV